MRTFPNLDGLYVAKLSRTAVLEGGKQVGVLLLGRLRSLQIKIQEHSIYYQDTHHQLITYCGVIKLEKGNKATDWTQP